MRNTAIIDKLRKRAAECRRTTAQSDPDHYLHVVAKLTQADGVLMDEAASVIQELYNSERFS